MKLKMIFRLENDNEIYPPRVSYARRTINSVAEERQKAETGIRTENRREMRIFYIKINFIV